ncbi:hemerythrin domain-containing protein [Sphaerisporangium fuscum]|uniref:hemerythrin domain-containing protein n=1 Tax=Sphaerisporangium fuscum TaxID=2835868 RepID=UPI001BDBF300|nr:hemerythrin domain-containing protein [Sphaerisporangium fuscum]
MAVDVITMITRDHRDVESIFERLKQLPEDRPVLLVELAAKFFAHSKAEEELVYPEITKTVPKERQQVQEGSEEHHQAEDLLLRLMKLDPDDKEFESLLTEVEQAINHHVQEEEQEILPGFQKAADPKRLQELARPFSEIKAKEIMKGLPGGDGRRPRAAQKKQGGDLEQLSKDELMERAKEAEISGRSDMNKEQLVKALQKAGAR